MSRAPRAGASKTWVWPWPAWEIKELLDHAVDAVVDSGDCGIEPTTVVDLSDGEPAIVRYGAGDTERFT